MFLSFGIAIALGAHSIGLIDADIRTFKKVQLDRLFYPVVTLDYDFSKAYYSRLMEKALYGKVKRLLLDPLLLALKRKFSLECGSKKSSKLYLTPAKAGDVTIKRGFWRTNTFKVYQFEN